MALSEIHPAAVKVDKILSRIDEGDIKIPAFQRGFVWDQEKIIELLDSVYRDYPIGSILLWSSQEKLKSSRNICGFLLPDRPSSYPVNYVPASRGYSHGPPAPAALLGERAKKPATNKKVNTQNNNNTAAPSVTTAPRNPARGVLNFVVTLTTAKEIRSYPCRSRESALKLAERFIAGVTKPAPQPESEPGPAPAAEAVAA